MAGRWNVPSVILNYICNAYNVPHYNAAENEKYVPDSGNTALSTGVSSECSVESVKDFANYLAEYLGCFIVAAPDGRVRFSRLGEREYKTELNKSNISRGTLQRSPYYVHPSVWKVSFDSGYGSSWYVSSDLPDDAAPLSINITNNPFWQVQEDRVPADIYGGKVTQMIKYMWDYLYNAAIKKDGNTVEYMINPFSCTVHVPYHFRIGDIVTVRDYVNGDVFRSYLTDITWTFRGGQQISCAGDDTRTLSVGTSRSAAKKSNDYSKYLYRKSKTGSSGGDTNTYTKAEIDAKDASVKSAADKAQATADSAVSVNNTQNTQISALQKSSHTHSNKSVLDKTEQPYTTAEKEKLDGKQDKLTAGDNVTIQGNTISSENTRYKFAVNGTGLEITQSTSTDFYKISFPSTRSITSLIPYFPNSHDDGRGFCWCQLAFTVVESSAYDYKKIGIEGGYEQGTRIYYKPQGVAKITIALYGGSDRRGVSITADLPLHNGELFELRPLENLNIFSSAPEKKLSVYAVGHYSGVDMNLGGKTKYDLYLFLYADKSYTATNPGVEVTVETSVYPFGGGCADVNRNYSNVVQLDSSAISESIRMSAAKVEAVTDILASKADKSEMPDISGKQDKLTAGANITISDNTISAKDTTYGNASDSAAGLMTAEDKKKLEGMDLSKYLPLSGGKMSGDIDMATNQKDIVVGTHRSSTSGLPTAVAGGTVSEKLSFETGLPERKSLIGSWLDQNSVWHNILSVRHKNGWNNGPNYGFYLRSLLTSEGNLAWNKQTGASEWQGERVLLDSTNYSTYAATKDHSHGLLNKTLCITIPSTTEDAGWSLLNTTYTGHLLKSIRTSANAPDWLFGNYSAGICFGGADTHGVIMCAYDTPKVKIAGGNGTKPKWYFTFQGKSGTIYDFESMPYAKVAATLTDSGWVAMTVEGYAKSGTVKYRTYGKQITITGSVVLKNDIATSYPAPQNIASTTFDFSKIVGCSGVGHSSSGVGAYVAVENYSGDNLVCVYALGSKIAAGSTLIFTITGFID